MNKRHAALVGGRGKSRHVADDTPADGDQYGFAVTGVGKQRIKNQIEGLPILVCFAIRQHDTDDIPARMLELRLQRHAMERINQRVGNNHQPCRRAHVGDGRWVIEQARADHDVVAAGVE